VKTAKDSAKDGAPSDGQTPYAVFCGPNHPRLASCLDRDQLMGLCKPWPMTPCVNVSRAKGLAVIQAWWAKLAANSAGALLGAKGSRAQIPPPRPTPSTYPFRIGGTRWSLAAASLDRGCRVSAIAWEVDIQPRRVVRPAFKSRFDWSPPSATRPCTDCSGCSWRSRRIGRCAGAQLAAAHAVPRPSAPRQRLPGAYWDHAHPVPRPLCGRA